MTISYQSFCEPTEKTQTGPNLLRIWNAKSWIQKENIQQEKVDSARQTYFTQFLFGKLINYKVHPSKKCPKSVENILVFPLRKKLLRKLSQFYGYISFCFVTITIGRRFVFRKRETKDILADKWVNNKDRGNSCKNNKKLTEI